MREWLLKIRKEQGLSQQAVADKAGISQSYYAYIERGERGTAIKVGIAQAIADALGFDWLMFFTHQTDVQPGAGRPGRE